MLFREVRSRVSCTFIGVWIRSLVSSLRKGGRRRGRGRGSGFLDLAGTYLLQVFRFSMPFAYHSILETAVGALCQTRSECPECPEHFKYFRFFKCSECPKIS